MNNGDQPPLEQFIGTLQESTLSELCKYLVMSDEQKFKKSNYNFFTIKYDDKKIHENIFIKFLEEKIINYAVTYKERSILEYKDMMKMAKSLFVKKRVNSGEAGELILFLILESRGIIQLLNKMNMKQSPEKNINGADAIHIEIKHNKIFLHFGESKMHTKLYKAIDESLSDVEKFFSEESNKKYELHITSSNIDDEKFRIYANPISDLINPYLDEPSKLHLIQYSTHDIFVGYQENIIKHNVNNDNFKQIINKELPKSHIKIKEKTYEKILKHGDSKRHYNFYFLSLQDMEDFSNKFWNMLHNV